MRNIFKRDNYEHADDWASAVLSSEEADVFAKALDHCGWMIVSRPEIVAHCTERGIAVPPWQMNEPGADCPSWAEPRRQSPRLRLVD
jgi:hypothetical protein